MYHGVAVTEDRGQSWRPIGLTNASVQDMALLDDGAVLVATGGMGLFAGAAEPPQRGPRPLGPVAASLWPAAWLLGIVTGVPAIRRRWGLGWAAVWAVLGLLSGLVLPVAVFV